MRIARIARGSLTEGFPKSGHKCQHSEHWKVIEKLTSEFCLESTSLAYTLNLDGQRGRAHLQM